MSAAAYTYTARPTPEAHDRQRSACVALARALHLDIARTYSDEAGARPELARLLSDASAGRVSVVFVASLDRLGRTLPAAPQIMADLHDAGVNVYAVNHETRQLAGVTTFADTLAVAIRASSRLRR